MSTTHNTTDMDQTFLVQYRNEMYDITEFVHKHPGGVNTLKGLQNHDMTERFMKAPPHSDAAMYLMREYKRRELEPLSRHGKQANGHTNLNGKCNGMNGHAKEVYPTDESMEHLVDWSKPMVPQIGSLGDKYTEWVNKPVDRPLRLFGPWYIEMITKTPWWVVPTFWIPVISYILITEPQGLQLKVINVICGIFLWTFIEYTLHRWVFHLKTERTNTAWRLFHFLLHGLHHKTPFDPYRLVFPPIPAVMLTALLYNPIAMVVPYPRILLAGALLGYLGYDMIHYYLHYGNPSGWHLYNMKRYHYQHHFVHHRLGFGISSPIWDFVFGTRIYLRKLKYLLRW